MYEPFELSKPIIGKETFVSSSDGTNIFTITSGQGEKTVLLAHGYGFSNIEWNIIVPMLNDLGYQTIVFDQRGHGKSTIGKDGITSASMASDYHSIITHFDLKDVILVGHSMGGFLSMKFLISYPELQHKAINGLVLMATFAGDIYKNNIQNKLQLPLIKSGILQKIIKWKPIGNAFAKSLLGKNPDAELVRVVPEIFLKQDHSKLLPILEAFGVENYYPELHKITLPTAVVIGTKDATSPPFHTDDLVKMIPNATRIDVLDKGHCLNAEAPNEIVKAVQLVDC